MGVDVSIARWRRGELVGGVVLTDYYRHHSISIHVYGWDKHWLTRDFIYVVFNYIFNTLKVKHLFTDSREREMSFDMNFGFQPVARIDNFYPDDSKIILRLDREDCRFLTKPRRIAQRMN